MWETINIIKQMGKWKPRVVIWGNVKNVLSKHMRYNFNRYLEEMEKLGNTSNYKVLNAMDFGLPQNRNRVFTIGCLNGSLFNFDTLEKIEMKNIELFLEKKVSEEYLVNQPSVLNAIGKKGIKRASVIKDFASL